MIKVRNESILFGLDEWMTNLDLFEYNLNKCISFQKSGFSYVIYKKRLSIKIKFFLK